MQRNGHNLTFPLRHFFHRHRRVFFVSALLLTLFAGVSPGIFANFSVLRNGEPGTNGNKTLLINDWTITPAGIQTTLGNLPLNAVLSPDGRTLLVVNSGAGVQSLQVLSTADNHIMQTIPYPVPGSVFVGLTYSPDGKHAYASGGGSDVVHTYDVSDDGVLSPTGDVVIGTTAQNPFPTGLSISPDGSALYVANNLTNNVSIVDTTKKMVTGTVAIGQFPYTTLVSRDGKTVYASNWGDATIAVINPATRMVTKTIAVGNHPSAMALGPDDLLFVTNSNSDSISVIDTDSNRVVRTISVAPFEHAPLSTSPQGLAVSYDQKFLYVANAGNNDIAIFALKGDDGHEQLLGRIPTAWYPTSVVVSRDNKTLFVTNAKGRGAGPNATGFFPDPTRKTDPIIDGITGNADGYCNCTFNNFTGSMIMGTLSTIAVPSKGRLRLYTEEVSRNNRERDKSILERSPGNPIPLPGGQSPIKHVIYIIKENRTYDQVFGDIPIADGAPALTLFPEANTPNLHSLAERFGVLDNFYADAEVSADGHNWASSANASDYNEKMWPQHYSSGAGRNRGYDFEGASSINLSAGGYLWDAAAAAHITYRDYGEFYQFDANYPASRGKLIPESQADTCAGPIAHTYKGVNIPAGQVLCFLPMDINPTTTPNLVGHFDPRFRTFDMNYRESERFAEWNREFQAFIANNDMPQLEILRLPNDHTSGTQPGALTPQAAVAENDDAVGKIVEAVSQSKYWGSTAIFVTEDDAQNGPDHVDSHRTESLVVSPYTSRTQAHVDHTLYDTAAMVRTMELILGLHPLSQYDQAAMPMWRLFDRKPDLRPYEALPEQFPVTQVNTMASFDAQQSAQMDFSQEDRIPMDALNQILWHAVKGSSTPYPTTSDTASTQSSTEQDG